MFFIWNLHTKNAQKIRLKPLEWKKCKLTHTHLYPIIYQHLCTLEHIKTDSFFTVRWHHAFAGTHLLFQTPNSSLVASQCEWLRLHRLKRAQCFYAFNAQTDKICPKYHHTAACSTYLYSHIYIHLCTDCFSLLLRLHLSICTGCTHHILYKIYICFK